MPRAGWRKQQSDRRFSDLVSVGVLARVFPQALVDEVIVETGRKEQRHRSLPARAMTYFAVGMALHSEGSYEDVLGLMTDGLAWAGRGAEPVRLPSKSAIFQARVRLGSEPVEALFRRAAVPLAVSGSVGAWLAGRRLVAIDGTTLDVADTVDNEEHFGRPGVSKGEKAAFPQARVVAVAECGTHAIIDAEVGPYRSGERELARPLLDRLTADVLLIADRGFYSFALWHKAIEGGADLLWRIPASVKPRQLEVLADGSWLAQLMPPNTPGPDDGPPIVVRVIDFTIDDGRGPSEPYRLFTTIVDPTRATAEELAATYVQRWEIELAFDELKTHQRGPRIVLRSKSPDLVYQEIWGHLCCHYAIRTLMFAAAHDAAVDPDRVSFTAALRITRRSLSRARDFSPSGQ